MPGRLIDSFIRFMETFVQGGAISVNPDETEVEDKISGTFFIVYLR